jgi:hypothetical protein
MTDWHRTTLTQPEDTPRFGRRASDRGFASPTTWFGRRAGDKKAPVRHSLPFAAQVAAQIAPTPTTPDPTPAYASARTIRSGLVKDLKA